jgi:hypothetical protein
MLIDDFKENCILLEKTRMPDGAGGWATVWTEGAQFQAAIVAVSSTNAIIAEAQGMKKIFNVTTEKTMPLSFHDVFQRVKDGKYFRVTSDGNDTQTPSTASFQFSQVTAEEYQLEGTT